jgi:hypothetical protein
VAGQDAFYEWLPEPGAVVCIHLDPLYGWRLDESRRLRNAPVPKAVRQGVVAELRKMGVHVGLTSWDIESALSRAHEADFRAPNLIETVDYCFGD